MSALLEVAGLTRRFGGLVAVDSLGFSVTARRDRGPAGTQRLGQDDRAQSPVGRARPDSGAVAFRGHAIAGKPAHRIARLGMARTFQLVRPLASLSCRDNVLTGLAFGRRNAWGAAARTEADALLDRVGLGRARDTLPGELTYIDQKRLELARALALDPELLLLDEWLAGLNPTELEEGIGLIRALARAGHHHPAGRARHGRHPLALPSLPGDERRPADRRGPAGRGAGRPGSDPRLSRGRERCLRSRVSPSSTASIARVDDAALNVAASEIVVILGANGAGKSTLLKAVAGLQPPGAGARVALDDRELVGLPPHRIVEAGLALVPEGRGIFGELTVRENLLLGAFARRARADEAHNRERVLALFPRLAERLDQTARTMSGGEQQMVAIGRALMSAPRMLLLDEPSLGLSPLLSGELFRALGRIRDDGIGVLLVEQNARKSLAIADRGYLIENGRIVGAGRAAELASDPAVQRAYLGGAR